MLSSSASAHFDGRSLQPCDNRPPVRAQRPVTVPMMVLTVAGKDMFAQCHKQPADMVIYGCTFLPTATQPAFVLINADQDATERACTLLYEKAHLPPNNWLDPVMEAASPDAVPTLGPAGGVSRTASTSSSRNPARD